jgi:dihydrofolate reductase
MSKLVVSEFISLDGVIESPEKWHFPFLSEDMGEYVQKEFFGMDGSLMGRITYEAFAGFWPSMDDEFAKKMNGMPKFVVSTTLERADWNNSTLLKSIEDVRKLKEEFEGTIGVTGSATLVRSLLQAGLIDELQLTVHPIVVGHGIRLFDNSLDTTTLQLVDTKTFSAGVVLLTYQPIATPK